MGSSSLSLSFTLIIFIWEQEGPSPGREGDFPLPFTLPGRNRHPKTTPGFALLQLVEW